MNSGLMAESVSAHYLEFMRVLRDFSITPLILAINLRTGTADTA
ncbi:hypothetical protein ABIC89_000862 [Variovorax boronicumulans]